MRKRFTRILAALALLVFMMPSLVGWGQTTVTQTSFTAISGNVNNDTKVSYASYKGNGTSDPVVNSNAIRLYQNADGNTGGYVVIGVSDGYQITSATIRSTMGTTTGYKLTDSDPGSVTPVKNTFNVSDYSLSANTDYTVSNISTQYITFACFGTNSSSRLYLSKISVTYESTSGGDTPSITLSETGTVNIDNCAVGTEICRTFNVSQSNLSADITLAATNGTPTPSSIEQNADPTVVTWTFTPQSAGEFTSTITATSGETSASFTYQGHAYANHNVNIASMEHGSVTANPTSTFYGQTVSLTVNPANGYVLGELTVKDANNTPVTVTNNSFNMPDSDVTVTATFVEHHALDIDFESATTAYPDWTFNNMTSAVASDSDVTAHGGNKFGTTGSSTASITTSSKIASPVSLTCYVSKKSNNTTASSWKIQVSSNGSTWEDVGDAQSASSMDKGEWVAFTRNLSSYSNVFVRVYYGSSTAIRCIDDLSLEYAPAQEYTLAVASVDHIAIKATVGTTDVTEGNTLDVEASKTVNLTVVSEDNNYQFDDWVVYKTGDESTTVTVTNNSFTMPEYPVTVSATTKEVRTITYSVNGTTSSTIYDKGTVVSLTAPTSGVPAKYTFVGWTANPANTADGDLVTSYTANENATFYAVFKKSNSITLTGNDFATSYPTTEAEYNIGGVKFGVLQVMKSGAIQFKSGVGYIYNKDAFVGLTSIVATRTTTYACTLTGGDSSNPSSGTKISASTSSYVDTYTISGNYQYILLKNGTGNAVKYSSIVFNFTGDETRYTRVFPDNTPATEDITITGPTIITSGSVLDMDSYTLTCNDASKLIIEDGGQLIFSTPAKAAAVKATLKKEITGFGNTNTVQTGWYTIASPLTANYTPAGDMLANTYDLYYYDEEGMIWLNYKQEGASHNHFDMIPEKGYLYANSTNTTLSFAGDVLASDATVTEALSFAAVDDNVKGFNLMGNPFTCNITNSSNVKIGSAAFSAYYIADGTITAGQNLIACNLADREIKPCEGFIVQATAVSQNLEFNPVADPGKRGETKVKSSFIRIEAGNEDFMDRAYVQLGEGNTLRKMTINDNVAQVYVMNDDKDYAAATIAEAQGEMPVNFKASQDGQYTITVNSEDVEMGYLHLIDNIAGKDIDLLANPSYTFNAKADDYESRFRLVFSANSENESGNENDNFAFISDGQLIVTGEGTLQVIDMMGRVISSEMVNGTTSKTIDAKAGVYVLRLINGENVKTQKIVIR